MAQHLCFRGGTWVPDGRFVIRQADYLWADLQKWRQHPVTWSDGVYARGTDVTKNRITIRVKTPYAAEQLAKNIEASEVPIEAVIIEVDKQLGPDDPPAVLVSEVGIEISVSFDAEVIPDKDVVFEVVLANTTNEAVEIEHGHPAEVDIVILTPDGKQVWRHQGGIRAGTGGSTKVRPGGQARFPVTWSQLDQDGFGIPTGDYLVRGFANFITYDSGRVNRQDLSTTPLPIQLINN